MKTITKAEVTATIAADTSAPVTVAAAKKPRAPKAVKTVEEALSTPIGEEVAKPAKKARAPKGHDGFKAGSGVFKCKECGKATRETPESGCEMCATCYEIAGLENVMQDNAPDSQEYKDAEYRILALELAKKPVVLDPEAEPARKLEGAINHILALDMFTMGDKPALREGTRKAAVWEAMAAVCPATRSELVAAAEAAEQEWRKGTKRLEAAKPGAKWFRRFAPVAVVTPAEAI